MRRDLRLPEYNLTDAELESLDDRGLEAHAKRFIFGLGRASGIQIRPRSFEGTRHERMRHLAHAVLASEKSPPDVVLGSACVALAAELHEALASPRESCPLLKVLIRYINARLEILCVGWVE